METMLGFQKLLMESLGVKGSDVSSHEFLSGAIGLSTEAAEILDVLNTKTRPWAESENGEATRARIAEELIDVMFYTLELFAMLDVNSKEIKQMYGQKLIINVCRAFAHHAPSPSDRQRALEWFIGDSFTESAFVMSTLDISTLSMAIDLYYPQHSIDDFRTPDFFNSPVEFAKKWTASHEPDSNLRSV